MKRIANIISIALAFAAGAVLAPAAVQAVTAHEQSVSDHINIAGCVVRFNSSGPVLYQNAAHACVGVTSVSVNPSGDLVIYRGDSTGVIVSVTAAVDETLASRQITAGASGGGHTTIVKMYKTDNGNHVSATSPAVTSPYSNLWMTWIEWAP